VTAGNTPFQFIAFFISKLAHTKRFFSHWINLY
jgi:hypothetical protein